MLFKDMRFKSVRYYKATAKKKRIIIKNLHWARDSQVDMLFELLENDVSINLNDAFLIDFNGNIYRLYQEYYTGDITPFGYYYNLSSVSIAVLNEGVVVKKGNSYISSYTGRINEKDVIQLSEWRGYNYFAKYTDEQIDALCDLILYLLRNNDITFNFTNTFDVIQRIDLPGVYFYCNFSVSALHPTPALFKLSDKLKHIARYG